MYEGLKFSVPSALTLWTINFGAKKVNLAANSTLPCPRVGGCKGMLPCVGFTLGQMH